MWTSATNVNHSLLTTDAFGLVFVKGDEFPGPFCPGIRAVAIFDVLLFNIFSSEAMPPSMGAIPPSLGTSIAGVSGRDSAGVAAMLDMGGTIGLTPEGSD